MTLPLVASFTGIAFPWMARLVTFVPAWKLKRTRACACCARDSVVTGGQLKSSSNQGGSTKSVTRLRAHSTPNAKQVMAAANNTIAM